MALALKNLKRVDMPLNKKKPNLGIMLGNITKEIFEEEICVTEEILGNSFLWDEVLIIQREH